MWLCGLIGVSPQTNRAYNDEDEIYSYRGVSIVLWTNYLEKLIFAQFTRVSFALPESIVLLAI